MMQTGAFVLAGFVGLGLFAACGVGDDTTPPHDVTPRTCKAAGTTTGTWTQSLVDPDLDGDGQPDILGCWDAGVWSFSATIVTSDCATAPVMLPTYKFSSTYQITPAGCTPGSKDANGNPLCELSSEMYAYMTDPAQHAHVKTTSGGGGICEGELELFSPDGKKVWTFAPVLSAYSADKTTGTVGGQWEYAEYADDQWTVEGI